MIVSSYDIAVACVDALTLHQPHICVFQRLSLFVSASFRLIGSSASRKYDAFEGGKAPIAFSGAADGGSSVKPKLRRIYLVVQGTAPPPLLQ